MQALKLSLNFNWLATNNLTIMATTKAKATKLDATLKVVAGKTYSIYFEPESAWFDVTVTAVKGSKVDVLYADDFTETRNLSELEPPLNPEVRDRFEMLGTLIKHVANGNLTSLVNTGQPGIGKTYTVLNILGALGYQEDVDYIFIKGHSSPFSLYKTLYDNQERLIVFDDCDSVFDTEIGANILKAVLDTTGSRKVSWKSNERTLGDYPDTFNFRGQVIFLSNLQLDAIPSAVLSRSVMLDLWLTPEEVVDLLHLRKAAMAEDIGATVQQADEVIALIDKYRHTIPVLSLRTLHLGLKTYVATGDLQLVRYQILRNSRA